MNRDCLVSIAKETIAISEKGFYVKDGKKIMLRDYCVDKDFSDVIVISRKKGRMIKKDYDSFYSNRMFNWEYANFSVENIDSFECARRYDNVLVMNFANARNPGGGFLKGAMAQEESLCRCSTLYKSISSKKASEMYRFNNTHYIKTESDYMLLSPNVCVFRDSKLNLLDRPYEVGVITVPAPNRKKSAAHVPINELRVEMVEKIRNMLRVAVKYGYRNLVLGAWGCGAFGNDTMDVAICFYMALIDEGFGKFFNNICFAILNDEKKLNEFSQWFSPQKDYKEFEEALIDCVDDDCDEFDLNCEENGYEEWDNDDGNKYYKLEENEFEEWDNDNGNKYYKLEENEFEEEYEIDEDYEPDEDESNQEYEFQDMSHGNNIANKNYLEGDFDMPPCNYTECVDGDNLGYTQGIIGDGIPFVAELWKNDMGKNMSVLIPNIYPGECIYVNETEEDLNHINEEPEEGSESKSTEKKIKKSKIRVGNRVGFNYDVATVHLGILSIGLYMLGEVYDLDMIVDYVDYIEENGLFKFLGSVCNGSVTILEDEDGFEYAYIAVMLDSEGVEEAVTDLNFRHFDVDTDENVTKFEVIKGGNGKDR